MLSDEEWNGLLNQVQHRQEITNDIYYQSVKKFLDSLYEKRKQWAARWTWEYLTLGAHSTQRSESVHASIKHYLKSNTLLTHLSNKIDENRDTLSDQNKGRATRLALKMATYSTKHPIEKSLNITPFAPTIVRAQIAQCMQYCDDEVSRSSSSGELSFEIRHILSGDDPSGKFDIMLLLARSACSRYAGCEHLVFALEPSALG